MVELANVSMEKNVLSNKSDQVKHPLKYVRWKRQKNVFALLVQKIQIASTILTNAKMENVV
jgi:hypothetical protein